ncbi:glycosyltransferase family 2 protein [Arthrobacter sp. zg-Y179]|uniref:glycosyltransferase family 2 protein n=1 Tax=Arthrobacter sp. zg-Y179 TaxID=2894188 RepID=UPI001E2BFFAE|nr:glycosyltransferase [Arthrobacter sp. zg-Y179]MCC9174261.1 glycosyltransferase [Arthrobacter sp. zg-Y179]
MSSPADISVVIGFKDWGMERLLLSIRSIMQSFGPLKGEVIVSDYGSELPSSLQEHVEALGAKYVYTSTNGVWSRSRALNAGFAQSTGRVLVSTDADMLFTPESMAIIGERILQNSSEALVLQCRDLPERFHAAAIDPSNFQWQHYSDASTLRPRWGMGGMMAVSRETYLGIRGFDERMEIYGGEDMDFAQRVRWFGTRLSWLEDPRVRMYHMWHPSSRQDVSQSPEGVAAIKFNRDIFLNDKSVVRNTKRWTHQPHDAPPLASVVISTRNRAEYIPESIYSVLNQTVEDIEVLVIDDGSTDDTESVVQNIDDVRVRYFKRKPAGIAAARNFAASVSLSPYTVIHDDDDIMFPDRIENHFQALAGGISGTYGGWIDFQNRDANDCMANAGKEFSLSALLFSSKVYAHATLMLKTALIQQIGYDERLRSGSDYNLALRLARSGVKLAHTGHFHLIRRLHDRQVTAADSTVQKSSARVSSSLALRSIRPGKQKAIRERMKDSVPVEIAGADNPQALIQPYLPDHLTKRTLRIPPEHMILLPGRYMDDPRFTAVTLTDDISGAVLASYGELRDARWVDLASLTSAGVGFDLSSWPTDGAEVETPQASTRSGVETYLDSHLLRFLTTLPHEAGLLVLSGPAESLPRLGKDIVAAYTATDGEESALKTHAYLYTPDDLSEDLRGTLGKLHPSVTARYMDTELDPRSMLRQLESTNA